MPYRAFATPVLFAAFLASAGSALALDVSYPPSRALGDIAAWLQRDTPILPGQVVDVSPSAVTAITAAQPTGQPRGFLANIVSEAVDPQILAHEDVASWSIPVEVDCEKRIVRLGVMTGFHTRDLRTDPRTVRDADDAWVNPVASAPLGAVMRALCDRDFRRPFDGRLKVAAARSAPPPKPAPTPPAPAADAPRTPALRPTLTPASPAPPKPKATAAASAGGAAVQIGASPDAKDAEALLARLKTKFATDVGGHGAEVVTAEVDGKTVHRALITGFVSAAEASSLCEKLKAGGQACFVRR
ncbi:MAG TPA: SPOR domain-containing protein [Phenylobacterium sp.]|uniref:SPOR domain-containing protein n=1 Tax=Phenylobacterium sp. TaxID=1871053 RepID=UPI002C51A47C|nr:SPOR domain-containing protein [Phenylobacterium sp.]HXA37757.1 SPOR domain-containing protein [Phenylobacterium sp.]